LEIYINYKKEVLVDTENIKNIPILSWEIQWLSWVIKADNDENIRLEFQYKDIKGKMLSIIIQWSWDVQWYFLWNRPFLHCKSWIISENNICIKSYRFFKILLNMLSFPKQIWIARQNIALYDEWKMNEVLLINNGIYEVLKDIDLWYNYLFSYIFYSHAKNESNPIFNKISTISQPNWYTILPLHSNRVNNIIFNPYDILFLYTWSKIWYILNLSWWSEILYNFIDNPLVKTDRERLYGELNMIIE